MPPSSKKHACLSSGRNIRTTTVKDTCSQTQSIFRFVRVFAVASIPPHCVQALSKGLGVPIEVFSAMSPPLVLGDEFEGAPLRLSFHEHYYALGAHYNSVVPA